MPTFRLECITCGQRYQSQGCEHGTRSYCENCGQLLEASSPGQLVRTLLLSLSCLVLLIPANLYPILRFSFQGQWSETRLITGAMLLFHQNSPIVGFMVLFTSVLAPLALHLMVSAACIGLLLGWLPRLTRWLWRRLFEFQEWGMIDVYLLALGVGAIKLLAIGSVEPRPALWLMLLFVLISGLCLGNLNPGSIWTELRRQAPPSSLPQVGEWIPCYHCGSVQSESDEHTCAICEATLHPWTIDDRRVWAYLVATICLYVPANVLPVMKMSLMGNTDSYTIIGGISRIVAATTVTVILSETLRVPFPDFSAYLVFFVANDDASRSFKLGIAAMIAVTFALATTLTVDICFMDAPWFRVPATLLLVAGAVWLSRVFVIAAIGRLLAVLLALNLSLADTIFQPEVLTRTTLWLWSVAGLAIGVTVLVNRFIRGRPNAVVEAKGQKPGAFVADAFSNPEYIQFAGKTLLAVALCEIFMNAVAWPGIRTCMITCVVTALATLESQNQKQMLRLIGAFLGGVAGLATIVLIVPNLDTIIGLILFTGCFTFAFAWVAVGSPRSSYAGFQMALAFYLMLLPGFTTSIDLTSIRDRFMGILIGIMAMWLVFPPRKSGILPLANPR